MKLTLTLIALVAAYQQEAYGDSGSTAGEAQEPQGYEGAETQEASGYEGAETNYIHQVQEICLAPCPSHAPCLNKATGACTAKMTFSEPSYAAQSYESHESHGYAQEAQEGQEGQESQEEGSASAGYGRMLRNDGCPRGDKDSNDLYVSRRWPFWVGFALLLTPALMFLGSAFSDLINQKFLNGEDLAIKKGSFIETAPAAVQQSLQLRFQLNKSMKELIAGFICMIASLAYLTMATNHGFITRCCDGRSFYFIRYIDWLITTPLMLWELATLVSEFSAEEMTVGAAPVKTSGHDGDLYYLIFLDILMIGSGLIGSLMCDNDKWAFFGFSILVFIPIMKQLCDWNKEVSHDSTSDDSVIAKTGLVCIFHEPKKIYALAMHITVISWFFYPIVWIFAEGTGSLSANGEAIFYTILDIISKSIFGYVIISNLEAYKGTK